MLEFGTKTRALSKVLIVVFLKPVSTTFPSTSPNTTQSPCENELSNSSSTEEKKFAMMSLVANAIASPPIPSDAISAEISNPSRFNTKSAAMMTTMTYKILTTKFMTSFLTPFFVMFPSTTIP